MFAVYGFIGLSLVFLAFVLNILGISLRVISINPLFTIGYWLFFDAIDFKLNKKSILHKIKRRHSSFAYLILIGVFIGLFSDFLGTYVLNFWGWYYAGLPLWLQVLSYIKGLFFGYGVPILMYYSIYRVFATVVKNEFGIFGIKFFPKNVEKVFFSLSGLLGLMFLLVSTFSYFLGLDLLVLGSAFFGLFMFLEYVEYKRHERSLLKDIFEGRWNCILALILAGLITGFVWEFLNLFKPRWEYHNLPFESFAIAGIPISLLLAWVPFIAIYLSFYRAVFKGRDEIW